MDGDLQARSRRLVDTLSSRLPCPVCGRALDSVEAVLFQGSRLVHAKCWPGDETPTRVCGTCGQALDRFEPAAHDGRVTHHVLAGREQNERAASEDLIYLGTSPSCWLTLGESPQ
jgi:hypothetical protein